MKVTKVPGQTGFISGAIVTPAVKTELTIMVTALDVTGDPDKQGAALEIITTVITSPLFGV